MAKVHFIEVGRGKKSWEVTIPHISHRALLRAVEAAFVLRSRDIEFELDEATMEGEIYAGFRMVGRFRVEVAHG